MWPKLALNSRCSCLNPPSSLDCICPWCCINLSLLKVTMCTCLGTKTPNVPLWRRLPFLGHYWFLEGMWEGKTCFLFFFFYMYMVCMCLQVRPEIPGAGVNRQLWAPCSGYWKHSSSPVQKPYAEPLVQPHKTGLPCTPGRPLTYPLVLSLWTDGITGKCHHAQKILMEQTTVCYGVEFSHKCS